MCLLCEVQPVQVAFLYGLEHNVQVMMNFGLFSLFATVQLVRVLFFGELRDSESEVLAQVTAEWVLSLSAPACAVINAQAYCSCAEVTETDADVPDG
jgi:hypothetical protein